MKIPVRNAVISLAAHLVLLIALVQGLKLHIYGVVISYMFFAALMCVLNGLAIRKHLKYRQEMVRTFLIPSAASAVMGLAAWLVYRPLENLLGYRFAAVLSIMIAVPIYALFLLILHGITEEELYSFPKGRFLVKIFKKLHLL